MNKTMLVSVVFLISMLMVSGTAFADQIELTPEQIHSQQWHHARMTQDCPVPNQETGYRIVTSIPEKEYHKQKKKYFVVSYHDVITEEKLEEVLGELGYEKLDYKERKWAFSHWKYIGK